MDVRFLVEIGLCIALWYSSSAVANTTSRKLLTQTPLPVLLTLNQFVLATIFGFVLLRVAGVRKYVPLAPKAQPSYRKLTAVYTTGFLFVNAGYVMVNVSLAETLRSAEPLVTVVLALLFLKSEPVSRAELASMAPIVLGGALSSFGDSSFSLIGLLFVCISNLSFSLRSMYTKKLREHYDGDAFNVFFHVSKLGTIYLLGLLAVWEVFTPLVLMSPEDAAADQKSPTRFLVLANLDRILTTEMMSLAFVNGVTYVLYNQTSFYVLSRVRMVTHGVANAFRRVVTILCSVWYFGNRINMTNAFGISLAIAGVLLYAKAKDSARATAALPVAAGSAP